MKDPRKVGGRYLSGYWQQKYEVLAIDGPWIAVRWEDGRETTHLTGWDPNRDKVISEPEGANMTGTADFKEVLQRRVRNGMRLLDEKRPDWLEQIDLDELDAVEYSQCILGQLYGSYFDGRDEVEISQEEASDCGFTLPWSENSDEHWALLNEVWQEEISNARA